MEEQNIFGIEIAKVKTKSCPLIILQGSLPMADVKDRMKEQIDTGADKAKDVTTQGSRLGQQAKEQGSNVISSAAETAKGVVGSVAEAVGQAKDKVKEWGTAAGHTVSQATEAIKDTAVAASDTTSKVAKYAGDELTEFVKRYPLPSVLIALGTGFFIGRMLRTTL